MQGAAIYFQAKGVLNPPRAKSSVQLKIYASAAHMQYKSKTFFAWRDYTVTLICFV